MRENFALFEKYPHYVFNFTGANRYRMMKEYFPQDYAKVKTYVASGRWFPAGSSMEENDVNNPSAESIIRQILYGKEYFRREFGKTSAEYMLPDSFGFPASLPSILNHCGIKGFSTQKLLQQLRQNSHLGAGIPFDIGVWEGPDGRGVIAALNPRSYTGTVNEDLSRSEEWITQTEENGNQSGLFTGYHYYGTGDKGGSPAEDSVRMMERTITSGAGPLNVIASTAEQMFLDIKPDQAARLPRYQGDILLTEMSSGSISSQAYMKRWNRKNELLADAAERASVAAEWLGGRPYPLDRLTMAWTLVMGGQFHDILAGTASPKAYEYAWNDQALAMNQFTEVLTSATEAIASGLNTETKGRAIVVYNPLNIKREDVVEAAVPFPGGMPKGIRVVGPDGKELPAQLDGESIGATKMLFLAKVPSVGYAVYDIQPASSVGSASPSTLKVTRTSLENARYQIRVDQNGDIASIFDKSIKRELLSAPARLAFQSEKPSKSPAWNMDWTDQRRPPRDYVQGPAKISITEDGPVRVALRVEREAEGSKFIQTIRLSAGDAGNRVEIGNVIDWKTKEAALKATFPLTAANPEATYNWDIGTIQRSNNDEKKFEVPSHQWFDLTDKSGTYGVTVLSDCKNASDKPDDNTLRLTLLYTPGISDRAKFYFSDQATQDWGHHEFVYGLAGHVGEWRQEQTDWQAYRLNEPLIAFESSKHQGTLGRKFSLLSVSNSRVRVLALKGAEQSDEVIVRLVEMNGKPEENVRISFAAPISAAREVNGAEEPAGEATVTKGELVTTFGPYQLRTFALRLAAASSKVAVPQSWPLPLSYDRAVASVEGTKASSGFDSLGRSLPSEMLPTEIMYDGIHFKLARGGDGNANAIVSKGQTIPLPASKFNRLYLLAASANGDQRVTFRLGNNPINLTIQEWGGYIGQWDNRMWNIKQEHVVPGEPGIPPGATIRTVMEYLGLTPGFIKASPVAWFASHRHTPDGVNQPYAYSYLFAYSIDAPANARSVTLPDNDKIRILAVTVANVSGEVRPAQSLYDMGALASKPGQTLTTAEKACWAVQNPQWLGE